MQVQTVLLKLFSLELLFALVTRCNVSPRFLSLSLSLSLSLFSDKNNAVVEIIRFSSSGWVDHSLERTIAKKGAQCVCVCRCAV